jgi:hypothetical protein
VYPCNKWEETLVQSEGFIPSFSTSAYQKVITKSKSVSSAYYDECTNPDFQTIFGNAKIPSLFKPPLLPFRNPQLFKTSELKELAIPHSNVANPYYADIPSLGNIKYVFYPF